MFKHLHQYVTLDSYSDEQQTTSPSMKRSLLNSNYTRKVLAPDKELLTRFKSQVVFSDLMNKKEVLVPTKDCIR